MEGKTVVVTGANSGIGKETARALAEQGARVLMHARRPEAGERAVAEVKRRSGSEQVELVLADLSSMSQVVGLAEEVLDRCPSLDVLVNNAGLLRRRREETADGFEMTFGVNHLATFLLTARLLARLKESAPARIVTVASRAHVGKQLAFDDLQSEQGYSLMDVYGKSKLANILFTRELARRLEGSDVTANCLHPGVVATSIADRENAGILGALAWLLGRPFMISPQKGAATSIYLATSPEVGDVTGEYYDQCKVQRTSSAALDMEAAARLWLASEELLEPWMADGG